MAGHPIVHIEIPADNVQSAARFYADVFGWQTQLDSEFNYLMWQAEGGPGGAFVQVGDSSGGDLDMPYKVGEPLLYIGSEDIEADLAQITAHGGQLLVPKQEIPHTGWFAIFRDPAGNRMALFASMEQPG